ncbi:hypothetical protein E2C01_031538 [Portunus trituberculatus]|uniref:Uncharacterized protein n=1 Tax=Portunus trituberculatus TaxID=210409 RepID=A0A5B7EXX7_PORTR|nr:hypothetical protein [Portunus trituberculatus]
MLDFVSPSCSPFFQDELCRNGRKPRERHSVLPCLIREGNYVRGTLWKAMSSGGRPPEIVAVHNLHPSVQSVVGPSHVNNTAVSPSSEVNLDRLSTLLGVLIDKLDKLAVPTVSAEADFNFSHSDDEAAEVSQCLPEPDPLDDLNLLTTTQPADQYT